MTRNWVTLTDENRRLREILSKCATAIGNGAVVLPECSVEFMALIPGEIELARLRVARDAQTARDMLRFK